MFSNCGASNENATVGGSSAVALFPGLIEATLLNLEDLIDAQRSARLEATIVLLIVVEVVVTFNQPFAGHKH